MQEKIGSLQDGYTKAVRRDNRTVAQLQREIWASYKHVCSTAENPMHEDCGADWCFYQRDLAKGKTPPPGRVSKSHLNPFVASYVKPIYERLTDPALMARCLRRQTQNANECFHSTIWARCSKTNFVSRQRVQIAVALAAGEFNQGSRSMHAFMEHLGMRMNTKTLSLGLARDRKRVRKAEEAIEAVACHRREKRRLAAAREEQRREREEGGPSYQSGGF